MQMDDAEITEAMRRSESAIRSGEPLASDFWRAVSAVKADPALIEAHADRIGVLDSTAFRQWALVTVPLWIGNLVMLGGALLMVLLACSTIPGMLFYPVVHTMMGVFASLSLVMYLFAAAAISTACRLFFGLPNHEQSAT